MERRHVERGRKSHIPGSVQHGKHLGVFEGLLGKKISNIRQSKYVMSGGVKMDMRIFL